MARDVEALVLTMSADLRRFEKSMAAMSATADKRLTAVERRALQSQRSLSRIMDDAGRQMVGSLRNSLSALAPTVAAAFSTQQLIKYADAYTGLQNRLRATGLEGEALKRVEDSLYAAANRNGVAVSATAELYQRAAMARENLGASEKDLLNIVSGTSAALKLQGTSATEASGALLQLGQLLGGNMVQAQEYNSLIDQLPVVLEAVAKGSDRWGGSVNKLTRDVKDGKVSVQEWSAAMLKGFADIEGRAGSSATTVGAALQTLNNQLGRYIGQTDSSLSVTQRMAAGIEALANDLDTVIPIIGTVIGLIGTRYVFALTASTSALVANGIASLRLAGFQAAMTASMTGTTVTTLTATNAMRAFNVALLANPIGVVAAAVAALSAAIIFLGNRLEITGQAQRSVTAANDALKASTDAYAEAARIASVATGEEARVAREAAARKRELAIAARDAARAKLAEAAATVALINAEAQRQLELERRAPLRGDRPGSVRTIGRERNQQAENAEAGAAAARSAIAAANKAIADADNLINRSAASAAGAGGGGGGATGGSRAGARTATAAVSEEARRVEQLRAEVERLSYDLLSDTEKAAVDLAKVRDTLNAAVKAGLLTTDQALGIEGGLAAQGLQRPQAREIQPLEYSAPALADMQAIYDEQGRNMASSFVGVLRSNNIAEELGYRFRDAAFDQLEQVLSGAFSSLFKQQAQGGGGNWLSAIGNAIAGTFGKRATGGGVVGGQPYITGERRAEVFVPHTSGTIISSVQAAMGRVQQARSGPQDLKVSINLEGANGDETIRQIAYEAAAQGVAVAVSSSRSDMQTAQRRNSRRFV